MNRLLILYGCVLIGSTAIAAEKQQSPMAIAITDSEIRNMGTLEKPILELHLNAEVETSIDDADGQINEAAKAINLNDIIFIEEEEEIVLGFDPYDYLPQNFDPYKTYINFETIPYVEVEDEDAFGFDTTLHLPQGFDPYIAEVYVGSLNFIQEEDYNLGFDTTDYLPEGFSPYEVYFDLNSIIYIEDEDELDITLFFLQLNTSSYILKPCK